MSPEGSVQRAGDPEDPRHQGGLQLQDPRRVGEAQGHLLQVQGEVPRCRPRQGGGQGELMAIHPELCVR